MTTTPDRRPLRPLDLIAGIVLAIVGGLIGLIMLNLMAQLGNLGVECEGIAPDGLRCNPDYLAGMVALGTAIVVLGWFVTTGFFVVRVLRRRLAFFLPLIGIVVMIAGFYLVAILLQPYHPAV